jgi:hypothetical protein
MERMSDAERRELWDRWEAAYSLNTRPGQALGGMTPSAKLAEAMQ